MTKTVWIFPGQGSQKLGMGRELYDASQAARDVFNEVDDALSQKLSDVIFGDDEAALTMTENTQPALMAVSMAAVRCVEERLGKGFADMADYAAGHSLGEYTALTASGALTLRDCARLLRIRGRAMQEAVPQGQGAMAALVGVDIALAADIAQEAGKAEGAICEVANDNGASQVVISGNIAGIKAAEQAAKERKVKRFVPLAVSAPFHCLMMASAADIMAEALADARVEALDVPVIANVSVAEVSDADDVRASLVRQVTSRVRWRETMELLAARGVERAVEAGSGNVLSNLMKRSVKSISVNTLNSPEDIDEFCRMIGE